MTADVLIPVYRPDEKLKKLLFMLQAQKKKPDHIIIINTEEKFWDASLEKIPGLSVRHIKKADFDHASSRNLAAKASSADIMIFMTQDAVPADEDLVERLVMAFKNRGEKGEEVALAYARQLPCEDCRPAERFIREFNYPAKTFVRTSADIEKIGIKAFFSSNACCAYRSDIFRELGGFLAPSIFAEDMIFASRALKAGYAACYDGDACVVHSHNLGFCGQFHRNFDLAVSQAMHPEIFACTSSEKEGARMVFDVSGKLFKQGYFYLLPAFFLQCACKYAGYFTGKKYKHLPKGLVVGMSQNKSYWEQRKEGQVL